MELLQVAKLDPVSFSMALVEPSGSWFILPEGGRRLEGGRRKSKAVAPDSVVSAESGWEISEGLGEEVLDGEEEATVEE